MRNEIIARQFPIFFFLFPFCPFINIGDKKDRTDNLFVNNSIYFFVIPVISLVSLVKQRRALLGGNSSRNNQT